MFLKEKRDGTIKGQTVANSSAWRSHMLKEEPSSPVVDAESLLLSGVIGTKENCNVMTLDILSAFA